MSENVLDRIFDRFMYVTGVVILVFTLLPQPWHWRLAMARLLSWIFYRERKTDSIYMRFVLRRNHQFDMGKRTEGVLASSPYTDIKSVQALLAELDRRYDDKQLAKAELRAELSLNLESGDRISSIMKTAMASSF